MGVDIPGLPGQPTADSGDADGLGGWPVVASYRQNVVASCTPKVGPAATRYLLLTIYSDWSSPC